MQFKKSILTNIAKMVCGDAPYNGIFPYRSSSYLTRFFHNLDLNYQHDGSTRYWWVLSVLEQLNASSSSPVYPSNEIIKILESLVHPDYFHEAHCDKNLARNKMNELLKPYELYIEIEQSADTPHLFTLSENFISTAIQHKEIKKTFVFSPAVFNYPSVDQASNLVAVMMPFSEEFRLAFSAIKDACLSQQLSCLRADDIWANSNIMQDIFDLIYAARIVVVDFSGKNSNVMYETGIAHTLGKIVVPITQTLDDIPFDLKPHRALKYHPNKEGLTDLKNGLIKRFETIMNGNVWQDLSDLP